MYDILVAGGSIAGLSFGAEAAKRGAKVLVAEEHHEIGEPEKCDGMVSLRGLRKYGYPPDNRVVQNEIGAAVIHSPSGSQLSLNAKSLEVVVLGRSAYDRQVAEIAESNGARIMTGARVASVVEGADGVEAKVGGSVVRAKYYVDASGPSSSPRKGIIPAAKYELEGDWLEEHVVEVFMDAEKYPGFFAWVIPYGKHLAKVGVAGHGISPFRALDGFLSGRPSKILKRVSAPIYIGGPATHFVHGRTILVGESAGQVKPTTAGGIMTSIAGAVAAAKWACVSLERDDLGLLANYQAEWESGFLGEMRTMLRLRGIFEKLSNSDMEAIIAALDNPKLARKLSKADFDFHATALLGALGIAGLVKVARVIASAEVRALLVQP